MSRPFITLLHYAAPPTIGGVESTIAEHARLFSDHDYRVQIIAGSGETFDPRVPVHILPDAGSKSPRVLEISAELASGVQSDLFRSTIHELTARLAELVPADTRSTIIVHNALSLHKNLALTAALHELNQRRMFRLVAWCHDFAWTDPQYAREVHDGFPWDLLREPWDGVEYVVVSDARRRELAALWESRGGSQSQERQIRIVPPGIDPIEFLGIGEKTASLVRQLKLLDAAPLLLLPARLTRRKRVEYAIEVTQELHQLGLAAKLVVTGPPGPHNPKNAAYLQQLEEQARRGPEESVVFMHRHSRVSREMMRDLYLLSDALLFPSEREGFGIPLLEAGLTRLNVFCSNIEPFREVAGDRVHYIQAHAPPRAAAEMIARSMGNDAAYQLKHRVLAEYAWERIFTQRIEPLIR